MRVKKISNKKNWKCLEYKQLIVPTILSLARASGQG